MKRCILLFTALSILTAVFTIDSFAQRGMKWRGSGGWGPGSTYNRLYDAKTVETINGEVIAVDKITPAEGMSYGVHLMVETDEDTVSVHLGPAWYLENQDVKIEPKDKVEIKGSKIMFKGKPALIAAEVRKGDRLLRLRDESGIPVWSGWRRK
jgi:hypothetical protein